MPSKSFQRCQQNFHVTEATGEDLQNNKNAPSKSEIGLALPELLTAENTMEYNLTGPIFTVIIQRDRENFSDNVDITANLLKSSAWTTDNVDK